MKTVIETKAVGKIVINSVFKGDKLAPWGNGRENWNRHIVSVKVGEVLIRFDFWGSLAEGELRRDNDNIFALYCLLRDVLGVIDGFEDFCDRFGYDDDSIKALKMFRACERQLNKCLRLGDRDKLYSLINELQETYNL